MPLYLTNKVYDVFVNRILSTSSGRQPSSYVFKSAVAACNGSTQDWAHEQSVTALGGLMGPYSSKVNYHQLWGKGTQCLSCVSHEELIRLP